ncbi:MAG: tubulin-like doman-containing protein [Tannerellaceae bacterium]|jgi:hypothetical protein|nr:tubulin-like doman-containing protein [Tannerellaceae bacterium]
MDRLDLTNPNHILVGLGGTGGKVLKAIRKRIFQEFPNDDDRAKLAIGFVYVDSTREMMAPGDPSFRVMGKDASFTESEFVDIKTVDLKQILDNVSSFPGLKTIVRNGASMKNTLGEVGAAAGQKRRAGRILFAANCNSYLAALRGQYDKVRDITNNDSLNIHIFTGLAGGTGSGSIIDVIAQTRAQEAYRHANIMVYAMVPELDIPAGCQAGRYHQNGYAALRELSALNVGRFLPSDVIRGDEHVNLNITPNKQFGLMLYSNVNENGVVVNSFTELPQLLADTVYFRLFLEEKNGTTDGFLRSFSLENINDFCVEYSEKLRGNDKERARTKAISTFGIKRIIYPEKRILEHITYTIGERVLLQMQYNNFKEDFGFVKESARKDYRELYINDRNLREWRLDDSHLMLEERIFDTDRYCSRIETFWSEITNDYSYDAARGVDPEPLRFLENHCAETYNTAFRNRQGVEPYYQDKGNDQLLREQARYIIERIERDLYTKWYEGFLSLEDLLNICNTVLTYIRNRKDRIEADIAGVDERISLNKGDADANNYDFNNLSLLQRATGKSPRLYSDHQLIMKDLYTLRTQRVAYEFEGKLLGKLRAVFEEFSAEVSRFIGVLLVSMDAAEKRIADRNKNTKGIADLSGAIVEVSEDEKMLKIEQALILDKNQQETWAGNIRKAIAGNRTYAHFSELADTTNDDVIFDIFDTELSPRVREKHDQDYQHDKILGLNVLQQLQKVLLTETDIRNFANDVIKKSGTFLKLDDGELSKALNNNPNPVAQPESINRKTILVSMPADEGNESLKVFADRLKSAFRGAFGNATPGSIIQFDTSGSRMNEITIVSVRCCFPMRAISWLPYYDRAYNDMVNNRNETEAREARILLHSEGDGTDLPELMGERRISPQEFIPYLFIAVANNVLAIRENMREEKGWCIVTTDMFGSEIVTLIAPRFTDILTSEELTEEVLDTIKEKVDALLKNPDLKMSERSAMVEAVKVVMREYVSRECASPTSAKYQQYATEATKAIELINKR